MSFYEKDKLGPQCMQLELKGDGILGKWFIQFFEQSRKDAKRARIERAFSALLFKEVDVDLEKITRKIGKILIPEDHDIYTIRRVVEELTSSTYGDG